MMVLSADNTSLQLSTDFERQLVLELYRLLASLRAESMANGVTDLTTMQRSLALLLKIENSSTAPGADYETLIHVSQVSRTMVLSLQLRPVTSRGTRSKKWLPWRQMPLQAEPPTSA